MFKHFFGAALFAGLIVSSASALQQGQTPPPTTRPTPDVPPQDKNSTPKANVNDHRKAVSAFTKASKSSDPDVKAFADKTLPVLKDHLQRAEDLQKKAGK